MSAELLVAIAVLAVIIVILWNSKLAEHFAYSDPRIKNGARYATWISAKYPTFTWPGPQKIVVGFHFTKWCPHCRSLKPTWERIKGRLNIPGSKVVTIENDEEQNSVPFIQFVPKIVLYKDGVLHEYNGTHDEEKIMNWILKTTNERNTIFPFKL